MRSVLLAAATLGGGRELRGTLAIFAIVTLIAQLFFYVVRIVFAAAWWLLRTAFSGARQLTRRGSTI